MKKVLVILASFILSATVFAEQQTWTNYLGFGIRLPTDIPQEYEYDEGTLKNVKGINFSYVGLLETGFSAKGNCNIVMTKFFDVSFIGCEYNFGIGYGTILEEQWFLGVYGTFGQTILFGSGNGYDYTFSNLSLGVDVTGIYTLSNSFSVYGSIGINFLLPGTLEIKYNSMKDKSDTDATYSLVPVFGMCWKF